MSLEAPGSGTTLALAVGLCALVLTLAEVAVRYVPHTWIQRDGRFYTNVNVTLTERLSVDQSEFCASWYEGKLGWNRNLDAGWSNVALGRDGKRLPKHPIWMPLLSTPLFWAFGLHGTLIFNVLLIGLVAVGAFAVARRHASTSAAALAALALPLATGVRDHAYDYHVDVLMLALFVGGMALMQARRGLWAGVLIGVTVMLRPTALLWVPALALILAAERDWRTLRAALFGGAIPLAILAAANSWLYGMPWWSGYNRVLVVVDGQPQIAEVTNWFSVPLDEGLENLWQGPYGVRHRLTFMAAALPGLLILFRRKPGYAVPAAFTALGSVLLFATYVWYGSRFLWPSCALLVPALAVTFDEVEKRLRRRPEWRASLVAAFGALTLLVLHSSFFGPLSAHHAAGSLGELALHVALFAALAFGLARAAQRTGAGSLAIVAPLALVMLPTVRERVLAGGPDLVMAAFVSLAIGVRRPWLSFLFAIVAGLAGLKGFDPEASQPLSTLFTQAEGRPFAILLVLALVSLPLLGRRAFLLSPLFLLALPGVTSIGDGWPLFALALLVLPLPILTLVVAKKVVSAWRNTGTHGRALALGAIAAALFVCGLVPRLSSEPFRIASYAGVRRAQVSVGNVPCDFLAWEHLNWECAGLDYGVHGQSGLSTSQPLHVGGKKAPLFLISTVGRARTVRWKGIPATETLLLRWAVPDEMGGGGRLLVRIDGEELSRIELSHLPDGTIHETHFDTRRYAGREVALELEMRTPGRGVLVDGGFR